jgi:hypothetical protein
MAHLRELPKPECRKCKRGARYALYNYVNACQGEYCSSCAKKALKEHQEFERVAAELRRKGTHDF